MTEDEGFRNMIDISNFNTESLVLVHFTINVI